MNGAVVEQIAAVQQGLESLFGRRLGCPAVIAGLRRITAGASAQTWAFNLRSDGGEQELILRCGQDVSQFGGALSKSDEAAVITAAVAAGVSAPAIIAELQASDGLGEGFIMQRVEGETLPPKILREPRYQQAREILASQCGQTLAAIHSVAPPLLPNLVRSGAAEQLAYYRQAYRGYQQSLPVFDYAFQWLAKHPPRPSEAVLVHGDFRNGNLMIGGDGLRAVLDWELAHIGDPMEDLGWLCVNSWRFGQIDKPVGGFGRREDLYSAYAAASAREVDPVAVKYWELFGVLKWGVICLYQCDVHLQGHERSVERAAIGRRVSECELDILDLLQNG